MNETHHSIDVLLLSHTHTKTHPYTFKLFVSCSFVFYCFRSFDMWLLFQLGPTIHGLCLLTRPHTFAHALTHKNTTKTNNVYTYYRSLLNFWSTSYVTMAISSLQWEWKGKKERNGKRSIIVSISAGLALQTAILLLIQCALFVGDFFFVL